MWLIRKKLKPPPWGSVQETVPCCSPGFFPVCLLFPASGLWKHLASPLSPIYRLVSLHLAYLFLFNLSCLQHFIPWPSPKLFTYLLALLALCQLTSLCSWVDSSIFVNFFSVYRKCTLSLFQFLYYFTVLFFTDSVSPPFLCMQKNSQINFQVDPWLHAISSFVNVYQKPQLRIPFCPVLI